MEEDLKNDELKFFTDYFNEHFDNILQDYNLVFTGKSKNLKNLKVNNYFKIQY